MKLMVASVDIKCPFFFFFLVPLVTALPLLLLQQLPPRAEAKADDCIAC